MTSPPPGQFDDGFDDGFEPYGLDAWQTGNEDEYVVPPSFEPWFARIQMSRVVVATLALVGVATFSYTGGMDGQDALLRGIVAGMAGYFVAWTASLLIFGELYEAELRRRMQDLRVQRERRNQEMEELYRQRLAAKGLLPDGTPDPAAQPQGEQPASGTLGAAAPLEPSTGVPGMPGMQPMSQQPGQPPAGAGPGQVAA